MGKWIFHLPPKVKVLGSSPSTGASFFACISKEIRIFFGFFCTVSLIESHEWSIFLSAALHITALPDQHTKILNGQEIRGVSCKDRGKNRSRIWVVDQELGDQSQEDWGCVRDGLWCDSGLNRQLYRKAQWTGYYQHASGKDWGLLWLYKWLYYGAGYSFVRSNNIFLVPKDAWLATAFTSLEIDASMNQR